MVICSNCGQKTSGIDSCEWCKYPLLRGSEARRRNAQKQAEKEAELAAQEESRRKAEEEKQAREAQKQAEKEAKLAAQEESRRKAEEAKEVKQAAKSLKQIEETCEQLRAGTIDTKKAIQKLSDISEKIAK